MNFEQKLLEAVYLLGRIEGELMILKEEDGLSNVWRQSIECILSRLIEDSASIIYAERK